MPRGPAQKDSQNEGETHVPAAHFLRELRLKSGGDKDRYPLSVPAIQSLAPLEFTSPVSFFVGENGSGKSTLLEGIAWSANLPAIGAEDVRRDDTLEEVKYLSRSLKLTWGHRTSRGFFLRAEDFFGFAKRTTALRQELLRELAALDVTYADRSSHAKSLAAGPLKASLGDMERRYGVNLDANSHGQGFLKLFQNRFVPRGLYLLDEPEAPLSPHSQLALLIMIREMVRQEAQFIIATHSPILLAYPGATIFSFDKQPVSVVAYDELDHVTVTRDFLNAPERYLRALENG